MGFKFAFLCDLLSSLENNRTAKATVVKKDGPDIQTIGQWFARHDRHIHHAGTDRLALLSCMFPEKRPNRVYWLQATSLARVIARCLGLGSSRLSELDQWRRPGGPDLGQCVENVLRQAENYVPHSREVTVEEIDQALGMIASRCRFSGPQVRRQKTAVDVEGALSPLYRRLSGRDAKWLTRMILKSYSPVVFPQKHTLERFHFLLPHLLQFQDTLEGALEMLDSRPMNHFPSRPDPKLAANLCSIALEHLRPRTGIKIGRPEYFKARSIKHCHQMTQGRRMSIERKYDGEYCQIHVDLTNKQGPIQIFSKSGKDSTADRSGIIPVLEESLRMKTANCKFVHRCIVEGELLVWSDKQGRVADFHKLRKFLPRSGTFIGIENDSPPQPYEHLMIIFFDILLLDDDACLKLPHRQRRLLLQDVAQTIPGRAAIAEQEVLDFGRSDSQYRLEVSFANAIAQRWEGHVLKACEEPYFPLYSTGVENSFGRWIKLKKDYIPGLGDTVDLALIGASYDAQDAAALSSPEQQRWTHFLVGCLLNKEAVQLSEAVPRFRVIDVLDRHCMHRTVLYFLNQFGEFYACSPGDFEGFELEYAHGSLRRASTLFKKPFVAEMMGSGFEKPSGARDFALRFPRVVKIHTDRTFEDAASHRELQLLAEEARSVPTEDLLQEREQWCKRLKVGNGLNQYIVQRSQSPSSRSSSVEPDVHSMSGGSSVTSNEEEGVPDSFPSMDSSHQGTSRGAGVEQMNISLENVPAVYIDGTILPEELESSSHDDNVLAENENLSNYQSFSQREVDCVTEKSLGFLHSKPDGPRTKIEPANSFKPPAARLISLHYEQTQTLGVSSRDVRDARIPGEPSSSRKAYPRSPLTTIPVYMSGTPPKNATSKDGDSSGLRKFLQTLSTPESRSLLQHSNPEAVSHSTAFGIALVNPSESPLGQEIHNIAEALTRSLRSDTSHLPNGGKIFFLDSVILEQDIHSEDRQYCLRETWADIGRKFYYACLRWDLKSWDKMDCQLHSENCPQTSSGGHRGHPPPVVVSFDEDEILVLGEFKSIKPLLHIKDT